MNIFKQSLLIVLISPAIMTAQESEVKELTRKAIKANKKVIVAQNMMLSEMEQKKFWPVYNTYQVELDKLNARMMNLIHEYAEYYKYLTDKKAEMLLTEFFDIREEKIKLRKSYVDKFKDVLSPKRLLRYYQVENKLEAIIRHDMAREIPLVR